MNNKPILFFVFFILFISSVAAINECKGAIQAKESPCLLLLPLNTSAISCNTLNVDIYNNASTLLYSQTMEAYNSFNCNATFNVTSFGTYTFYYSTGDSGSITIQPEDDTMASLSITLFILLINIALFLCPFWVKFSDKEVWQNFFKKLLWTLGFTFLALNISILAKISDAAGYNLNGELLNVYLYIFSWMIYIMVLLMGINMITSTFSIRKQQKQKRQQGEQDYD